MKILLHICCGPCAIYCIDTLRESKNAIEGFFYNPNIHPLAEYNKRKDALASVSDKFNLPVFIHREYKIEDFFRKITLHEEDQRCNICWQLRLKAAAEFAKRENFDAFTTTLLISPYQDHEKIKDIATSLAKKYKIKFYYQDFRTGFRQSQDTAKQMEIYRQKYCGCVYSERDKIVSNKKDNQQEESSRV